MAGEGLRYPAASLRGDYARAAAGLALTALPLALMDTAAWMAAALGVSALLFTLFAARTAQRQFTRIVVDDRGVRAEGPLGGAVRWDGLRRLRLRFYATRRDRSAGWMQMTLAGSPGRIRVESTLDGFETLAARAAAAARRNGVALDDATVDNLLALGIDPDRA